MVAIGVTLKCEANKRNERERGKGRRHPEPAKQA